MLGTEVLFEYGLPWSDAVSARLHGFGGSDRLEAGPSFHHAPKSIAAVASAQASQQVVGGHIEASDGTQKKIKLAAIDSTGLQSHHCSSYYVKRRSREPNLWQTTTYQRFPKIGIICDTGTHMILEAHPSRGPCPDVAEFKRPLQRATQHVRIEVIVADAGYDSESNHQFAREELSVRSVIPANAGRPTKKPAKGKYRRQMQTSFDNKKYCQRWQCETVISMIKRRQAVATNGSILLEPVP